MALLACFYKNSLNIAVAHESKLGEIVNVLTDIDIEALLVDEELALSGEDLSGLPLYPDDLPPMPEVDAYLSEVFEVYASREAEINIWREKRREGQ